MRSNTSSTFFAFCSGLIHQNMVIRSIVMQLNRLVKMKLVKTIICPIEGSLKHFSSK